MKHPLEVTLAFEVAVELPNNVDVAGALPDFRTRLDTASLTLVHGTVERPTEILFQTEVISLPFSPRPDEFRCDSCRREFSNDEKHVNDDGDELCENCKNKKTMEIT